MEGLLDFILEKLTERNTYTALAAILLAAGVNIPPGYVQTGVFFTAALAGAAGVLLKEGWKKALASGDIAKAISDAANTAQTTTK